MTYPHPWQRALALAIVTLALAACGQREADEQAPGSSVGKSPAAAATGLAAPDSALTYADPSLPPASIVNSEMPSAAKSPTDAKATALNAAERDKAMPLEGQVNNYSSDASAKRGNANAPGINAGTPDGAQTPAAESTSSSPSTKEQK